MNVDGHLVHVIADMVIADMVRITNPIAVDRIFRGDICLLRDQNVYRIVGKPLDGDKIAIACDGFYPGESVRFVPGLPTHEIQN